MARPKSEDRRAALLDAATQVFAEQGLSAPTSLISSRAKVSEGSFFTYFKTKDDLINELYRDLRLQLADVVMTGFPRRAGIRERLEHIWTHWVTWGVENPQQRKALRLVGMSHVITAANRTETSALFAEVDQLHRDALEQKKIHVPPQMVSPTLKAMADMTTDLIERSPKQSKQLLETGFAMLWGALSAKP